MLPRHVTFRALDQGSRSRLDNSSSDRGHRVSRSPPLGMNKTPAVREGSG